MTDTTTASGLEQRLREVAPYTMKIGWDGAAKTITDSADALAKARVALEKTEASFVRLASLGYPEPITGSEKHIARIINEGIADLRIALDEMK